MPINRDDLEAIEKLLRLAERPGTIAEGESANRRAEAIALKAGINIIEVRARLFNVTKTTFKTTYASYDAEAKRTKAYTYSAPPKPQHEIFFHNIVQMLASIRGRCNFLYTNSDFFAPNSKKKFAGEDSYHRWNYQPNPNYYILVQNNTRRYDPVSNQFVFHKSTNVGWAFYDGKRCVANGFDVEVLKGLLLHYAYREVETKPDLTEHLRQMESICSSFNYTKTEYKLKVKFTSSDKLSSVSIQYDDGSFRISCFRFEMNETEVVGEGKTPGDLYEKLKFHIETEKTPSKMCQNVFYVAEEFGFSPGVNLPADAILWLYHFNDKSEIMVNKSNGRWMHKFHLKTLGQGSSDADLLKHLEEIYGNLEC